MDGYERQLELERGVIDLKTGEFPMTLATDGEASDGHILSIEGGRIPARMPMLFNHSAEAMLPSVGNISKSVKTEHEITGTGRVNMDGEGIPADIRRNFAQLIHDGDLNAMSIRWDTIGDPIRRINLPSDHPAFIDPEKAKGEQRWGLFFPRWRALEGSIVTIGADPKALIGRSEKCTGIVRTFFRALADQIEDSGDGMASLETAFNELGTSIEMLRELGATDAEIITALQLDLDASNYRIHEVDGQKFYVPKTVHADLVGEAYDAFRSASILNRIGEVDLDVDPELIQRIFSEKDPEEVSTDRRHAVEPESDVNVDSSKAEVQAQPEPAVRDLTVGDLKRLISGSSSEAARGAVRRFLGRVDDETHKERTQGSG